MIYIFLSICCSVFVSILLKLAKRYSIDASQAIVWNYSIAALLTWIIFRPGMESLQLSSYPLYLSLGILLPLLFLILAASIRYSGIVRTDIAQRLSLFIPIVAAFLLFSESLSTLKITGISIGFAAIICSIPWQKKEDKKSSNTAWIYLLLVFMGLGIIDILFKQLAQNKSTPFTSTLFLVFCIAFILSISVLLYFFITKKKRFSWKNFFSGMILGIANFGNILFYIKAHQSLSNDPSIVFSAMNIGVIIMGSLVGILIFKEKLSKLNYVGIFLALLSVFVISMV
ncbi:EamA family transporter [Daejeonella oryzae]|uniref:EamA family transporter n=1 Tax=Daejeonella oryzae TaxID=1122943 RepID=UPI00047C53FB|nr:EamA family transporter [Daejeonella oryzae]